MRDDDSPGTRTLFRRGPFTARVRVCQVGPEELEPTADADIRYCPSCKQRVVNVSDVLGVVNAVSLAECIASRDADNVQYMGSVVIEYHHGGPLRWDE